MPLRSLHEGETGAPVVVVVLYRCPSRNWSNSGELILSSDCHRGPTRSAAQYTGCPVESCKSEARLVMATGVSLHWSATELAWGALPSAIVHMYRCPASGCGGGLLLVGSAFGLSPERWGLCFALPLRSPF